MEGIQSLDEDQMIRRLKINKKSSVLSGRLLLNMDLAEVKKEKIRKAKLVQLAKVNKKRSWYWLIYLSLFSVYLTAVLTALFVSKMLISSHSNSTNELFKITMIYNDCNFHISDSASSFLDFKSVVYSRTILKVADHAMINKSFFTDNFYAFKKNSIEGDFLELAGKINQINDHLVNSKQLIDIGYSRDEFERSYDIKYNLTECTVPSNEAEEKTFFNLKLTTLQSIRKFRFAIGNELRLSPLAFGPILTDSRRFIIDKGLGDIIGRVHLQVSNSRTRFENLTSNYRKSFNSIIGTTSGVVALIFIIWLGVLYSHRKTVADILQTYCVLSFQTLEGEIDRINSIERAVYHNTFNAVENMKQARSSLNDLIPEQKDAWNDVGGTQYGETQSFGLKSKKSLKAILIKGKGGNNVFSNSSKFIHGTPVKVFWYVFFMILLLILIWGIEAILLNTIGQIVKESNTIKEKAMANIEHCMKLRVDFSRYFRLSPYVVIYLDVNQIADAYKELSYSDDHERYLKWWTQNKGILIEALGINSTFETFQNDDLCTLVLGAGFADEHPYQKAWPENIKIECETALNGVLKKGYFQYSIYEENMMQTVKQKLEPIIKDIHKMAKPDLVAKLQAVWFAPEFVQLRAWHQLVYSNLLAITMTEFVGDIEKKTASANLYVQTLEIVGIVLAILPLLFYVLVVIPLIIRTQKISLFTFDAISPLAIVSNQLSMNKYKAYYSVTGN